MKDRHVKFIFFFQDTPFTTKIPLKALTSQGKRFDVACRVIKSARFFNGDMSGTSVELWFADGKGTENAIRLIIDGGLLPKPVVEEHFFSELSVARFLKIEITKHFEMNPDILTPGVKIDVFSADLDVISCFLDSLGVLRDQEDFHVILLDERGESLFHDEICPRLSLKKEGFLTFKKLAFVIGDHSGFPEEVEGDLKNACETSICIGNGRTASGNATGNRSYLGSQIVKMLQFIVE